MLREPVDRETFVDSFLHYFFQLTFRMPAELACIPRWRGYARRANTAVSLNEASTTCKNDKVPTRMRMKAYHALTR